MSFKQSKILGFFQPKPKPKSESDKSGRNDALSNDVPRISSDSSKPKAAGDSKVVDGKARKPPAKTRPRNPPRHLQVRSDNAQRLPASSPPVLPTSSPELPPLPAPSPSSSAPTCRFPSEVDSAQLRTPKRITQDVASRFSSPLVRRPATPVVDPKQSFDLGYAPSSPTRTLFAPRTGDSNSSKRTADFALLSPKKDRLKTVRTNTTPLALSKLSESVPSLPSYLSSPSLPSSPLSPVAARPAFDPEMEIKGSDDEDGFSSDCSLPDLEMLLSRKPRQDMPPPAAKTTTPKTRLRGRRLGKSPLPSQPKPMFDMKTLLEHQKRDEAINASSTRLDDSTGEVATEDTETKSDAKDALPSPNTNRRKFISVAGVNDKEVAGKAMRAMERTEAATSTKDRWYFFKTGESPPAEQSQPFPRDAATGPWALLAKQGTRRQHLQSRTLQYMAARRRLPDEIFTWILLAIDGEKRALQLAYSSLVSANANQIRELVTPEYLQELYSHIGAAKEIGDKQLQLVQEDREAYAGRNWSGLRTYLEWLDSIACHLGSKSVRFVVVSLLRMAADKALMDDIGIRMAHQQALGHLIEVVEMAVWNDFHPDDQDIIKEAMHHLKDDDFHIKRKTNYVELRARIQLFDIALDDGSFDPSDLISDPVQAFNADVDELAQQLRTIWGSIKDSGAAYLSRTEAKNSIDCVQKRLTYSVRTKPPPKQSIFDQPEKRGVVTEMQKDFMSKFIGALKKPRLDDIKGGERRDSAHSSDDNSDADESFISAVGEL
ncbi:hypothetical protein ACHAQA_008956 [Verticillium albo-atrum]